MTDQAEATSDQPSIPGLEAPRKTKLLLWSAMGAAIFAATLGTIRSIHDGWGTAPPTLALIGSVGLFLVAALAMTAQRRPGAFRIASYGLPAVALVTLSSISWFDGGLNSDAVIWLPFVPLVAVLFTGAAGAWTAMALTVGWLVALYATGGGAPVVPDPGDGKDLMRLLAAVGAVGFGTLLGALYERYRRRTVRTLTSHQERLAQLHRLRDEYVSAVNHELRTPMTSIHGALTLLSQGEPDAESAERLINIAHASSARLSQLIDDLLDAKRLGRRELHLRRERLAVDALCAELLAEHGAYAASRGATLRLGEVEPVAVVSDRRRLLQVMSKLISNAVTHGGHGNEITLSAARSNGSVVLGVADRGPGIPPEFQARAFEKFARLDGSDTRETSGSGLGLYICRQLVEQVGGSIELDSGVGRGTTLRVILPAAN